MDTQAVAATQVDTGEVSVGRHAFFGLAVIATLITLVSALLHVAVYRTGHGESPWHAAFELFNVGQEGNAATWYASVLWVLVAVAAVVVAVHAPTHRWSWFFVALVAAYASVDEYAELHERLWWLGEVITRVVPFDPFPYRWIIAGVVLALLVVVLLIPLALKLPRNVLLGLVASGVVFLLGAVGFESAGGYAGEHFGELTWHVLTLIHIEEWLEKVGVAMAVWATLSMVRWQRKAAGFVTEFRGYRTGTAPKP